MNYIQVQEQAKESFQNCLYNEAREYFERCIELNPEEFSNYWYLGIASLLTGDELFAETLWMSLFIQASEEEADTLTEDLIAITEQIAIESFTAKRLADAETLYLKIQEIAPEYANAYLGLSHIQIETGEYQEAIETLQKLIEIEPDLAIAYYCLGHCFQSLQEFQTAINNFKQAISLKNDYVDAYYNLGVCLIEEEQHQQGIINFTTVIKLAPNHLNAHICLAECLYRIRKFTAAIKYFQKAREIEPNSEVILSGLSACFMSVGKIEKAQLLLSEALAKAPNSPLVYYNLGCCFRSLGQCNQAIEYFQKALELKPDWWDAKHFSQKLQESTTYCPKVRQGYNVWDAMLYKDEDCYRLLYLQGDSRANPSWIVGEMAMAVSIDLQTWEYCGMAIEPDPKSDWADGRILSGSLYKENGIYYLFYSAASSQDLLEERIGLATSTDCITWNRREKPLLEQDKRFYGSYPCIFTEKPAKQTPWRDPYVVKDFETGKYYMFITSSFGEGNFPNKGCIGLAVADHIDGDYKILPPVLIPMLEETQESIFVEMERPQIIYKNGKYNLFCSTSIKNINPKWLKKVGKEKITNFCLYWYVSDKITGPFEAVSEIPIVKGSKDTKLYGTNIVEAPDGTLFATGNDCLSRTLEVSPRYPVIWEGDHLEIIIERES